MSETSGDVPSAAQVIHLEDANAPEDDDRRYVATKLVNIAQCLDRAAGYDGA